MNINKIDLLGSYTAIFILFICILIFIARLFKKPKIEYLLGILFIFSFIPLSYFLLYANELKRPVIYYIQISLMLLFIIVELLVDYILNINFRNIKWMKILYVILFFGSTGGMIGIASLSGSIFTVISIILFLLMSFLAFFQHFKTGM